MYAGLAALGVLVVADKFLPASQKRVAAMLGTMSSAFGLALFAKSVEIYLTGDTLAFGRVYAYLARADIPFKYWAYFGLLMVAGGASCFAGIYLLRLAFKRPTERERVEALFNSKTIPDHLFATGTKIKADYTGIEFSIDGRKRALVAHARQQAAADPEYAKTIFAAALYYYGRFPSLAAADGISLADLNEMADGLFAMESRDPGTAGRADYRYRMLIQFGPPQAAWRTAALEALLDNVPQLVDNEKMAQALRCAVLNVEPGSSLYRIALQRLSDVFDAFQAPTAGTWDYRTAQLASFIARTNNLAIVGAPESERNGRLPAVPDHQLAHMARAALWHWTDACAAKSDHRHQRSLLLAAMDDGSAELAQEAMEALCGLFAELVSAAPAVAEATVHYIFGRSTFAFTGSRKARHAVFGACLARVLPSLEAVDPEAALRARRDGYQGSESWR